MIATTASELHQESRFADPKTVSQNRLNVQDDVDNLSVNEGRRFASAALTDHKYRKALIDLFSARSPAMIGPDSIVQSVRDAGYGIGNMSHLSQALTDTLDNDILCWAGTYKISSKWSTDGKHPFDKMKLPPAVLEIGRKAKTESDALVLVNGEEIKSFTFYDRILKTRECHGILTLDNTVRRPDNWPLQICQLAGKVGIRSHEAAFKAGKCDSINHYAGDFITYEYGRGTPKTTTNGLTIEVDPQGVAKISFHGTEVRKWTFLNNVLGWTQDGEEALLLFNDVNSVTAIQGFVRSTKPGATGIDIIGHEQNKKTGFLASRIFDSILITDMLINMNVLAAILLERVLERFQFGLDPYTPEYVSECLKTLQNLDSKIQSFSTLLPKSNFSLMPTTYDIKQIIFGIALSDRAVDMNKALKRLLTSIVGQAVKEGLTKVDHQAKQAGVSQEKQAVQCAADAFNCLLGISRLVRLVESIQDVAFQVASVASITRSHHVQHAVYLTAMISSEARKDALAATAVGVQTASAVVDQISTEVRNIAAENSYKGLRQFAEASKTATKALDTAREAANYWAKSTKTDCAFAADLSDLALGCAEACYDSLK